MAKVEPRFLLSGLFRHIETCCIQRNAPALKEADIWSKRLFKNVLGNGSEFCQTRTITTPSWHALVSVERAPLQSVNS